MMMRFFLHHKNRPDFDTYGHLYIGMKVRESKSLWRGILTDIAMPDGVRQKRHVQPALWNYFFASVLNRPDWKDFQWAINPLIEIFALCIYALLLQKFDVSPQVIALTVLCYLTTPALFTAKSRGPRLNALSPRLMGEVACCFLAFGVVTENSDNFGWLTLVFISAFYVFAASKFSYQVVILVFVPCLAYHQNWLSLLAIGLALGTVGLWSKGQFFVGFFDHLCRLKIRALATWRDEGFDLSNFKSRQRLDFSNGIKEFLKSFEIFIRDKPIFLFFYFPSLPLLLCGFLFFPSDGLPAHFEKSMDLTLFALGIYVLVCTKYFYFIGESERYIQAIGIIPIYAFVESFLTLEQPQWIFLHITYGLLFLLVEWLFIFLGRKSLKDSTISNKKSSILNDEEKIIDFLRARKNLVVGCYPYHALGAWRVMLETECKTVFPFTSGDEFQKFFYAKYGAYPNFDLMKINALINDLGLNCIVFNDIHNYSAFSADNASLRWSEAKLGLERHWVVVLV
jgi:hypothetical protein